MNYNQSDIQLTDSTESNISNDSMELEPINIVNNDKIQFLDNLSVETILTHCNKKIISDIQNLLVKCDGSFVKCFPSMQITSSGAKNSPERIDNVNSFINHVNQMILDYWKKITRPKIIEATNFLTDLPDSMRYLNTLCTFWTNNDEMLKMCLVIHEYCLHSLYDTLQIYASDATKKKITAPKLIHVILETNINRIIAVHSRTFFAYEIIMNVAANTDIEDLPLPLIHQRPLHINTIQNTPRKELADTILPLLLPLFIPKTFLSLRPEKRWRSLNIRFCNYTVAVVVYGLYKDDSRFPKNLHHHEFPPPWYTMDIFFKSFNLPGKKKPQSRPKKEFPVTSAKAPNAAPDTVNHDCFVETDILENSNDTEENNNIPKELVTNAPLQNKNPTPSSDFDTLRDEIVKAYNSLHCEILTKALYFYSQLNTSFIPENKSKKPDQEKWTYLDCVVRLGSKRPPIFNDLLDFIYKYRKDYKKGSFDESISNLEYPKNHPLYESYKERALCGLHRLEIALMEDVLKAKPFVPRPSKS